jgi:L-2-hydroxyglutarate oxidase LhgO
VTGPDGERFAVSSHIVINSAGLDSDRFAEMAGIDIITANYQLNYCRGHYFRLNSSPDYKVNHLIYPVPPTSTGLGIHITLDLGGGQKLGPDTQFLEERKQEYIVPNELINKFFASVKRYLPALTIDSISADQSGIRPKLQSKAGEFRDFVIKEESDKGLPGFINLIGIESPGLTCSLEIAKYVNGMI